MISILSTAPLADALVAGAAKSGIRIIVQPFITTVPVDSIDTIEEIAQAALLQANVIFTSTTALNAVLNQLGDQVPDWQIYCLSGATAKQASTYFGEGNIAGIADNAAELANSIIESGLVEEAYFFCGNLRRDELPHQLTAAGILVQEIRVYDTVITPHKVSGEFAAILFFSPSAADGFFKYNTVPEQALVFAIGPTTAEALRKYTRHKIILPDSPGKDRLIEKLIDILGRDHNANTI